MLDEASRVAIERVQRQIGEAVLEAFDHGFDYVHLPFEFSGPADFDWFNPAPTRHTVTVKGGPVSLGLDWPRDYTVYRVETWRALGEPRKWA